MFFYIESGYYILIPLPPYLAYNRCKTGTWISFRSFNYLMVLWLKKIRRQIENKAAEIWKCQYMYTELTQNVDSDWHCFWLRFYVSFSQSLIPVRLMCFWPIVKVWYQGWRNEILYSLYKLQLNARGNVFIQVLLTYLVWPSFHSSIAHLFFLEWFIPIFIQVLLT